jgi:uncharacterized damage-inducible protein DinB
MNAEAASYLERIEDLRSQVRALLAEHPPEALNWRPVEGEGDHAMNSPAVLATHIAGAERFWIGEVVGGRPPTRDRDAEFRVRTDSAVELDDLLERTGGETREILAALTAADLEGQRQARGRTVPVRWCILHVIDHTALHLGHLQITYQLWTGGQAWPAPRWFERLPSRRDDS